MPSLDVPLSAAVTRTLTGCRPIPGQSGPTPQSTIGTVILTFSESASY